MLQLAKPRYRFTPCALVVAMGLVVAAGVARADPDHRNPRIISTTSTGNTFGSRVATLDLGGFLNSDPFVAVSEPYRFFSNEGFGTSRGEVTLHQVVGATTTVHSTIIAPVVNAGFGDSLAVGDFDNDTVDDLMIGATRLDGHGGVYLWTYNDGAPTLELIYSDLGGDYAECGRSLAVGDFNGDGDEDVAIGCPLGDVGAVVNAGLVKVGYGDGEGGFTFVTLSQDSPGIAGGAESNDRFGFSLAVGDFDPGTLDDLVIGVPGEAVSGVVSAGAIHLLLGNANGLSGTGSQLIHQGTTGVPGEHQTSDRFGQSLAVGSRRDALNNRVWYVAVGIPGDGDHLGGSVMLFKDATDGLSTAGVEQITLFDFPADPNGLSPHPEPGSPHELGFSLAIEDLNRDQQPELMISITGDARVPPLVTTPGMLCIAFGQQGAAGTGLLAGGQRCFDGSQFGVATSNDEDFGVVAAADSLDGEAGADLVIASPGARQVFVLRNPLFGNGFEGGN